MFDITPGWRPANLRDGAGLGDRAGLRDLVALRVGCEIRLGLRVSLGFLVVVAALAGVMCVRHRIERPEGNVDPRHAPAVHELFQIAWGKPSPGDPLIECVNRMLLVDLEGQETLGQDHSVGRDRLVFQIVSTVRAAVSGDLVFEQHDRRTRLALNFRRPAGDRFGVAVGVLPVFVPVPFADLLRGRVDRLGIPAIRAFERPLRGFEIELCSAAGTGKFPAGRRLLLRFINCCLGLG